MASKHRMLSWQGKCGLYYYNVHVHVMWINTLKRVYEIITSPTPHHTQVRPTDSSLGSAQVRPTDSSLGSDCSTQVGPMDSS